MSRSPEPLWQSDGARFATALVCLLAVTAVLGPWLHVSNAATVSATYMLVVLLVAAASRLRIAVATSVAAVLCLNFFFLPPVGTFTIADPQNWIALFAFLVVSLVASHLSAVARLSARPGAEPVRRRWRRGRPACPACPLLPRQGRWDVHRAGSNVYLDPRQISSAFAAARTTLEFDAYARS
jgi:hypothetical protein